MGGVGYVQEIYRRDANTRAVEAVCDIYHPLFDGFM